MINRKAFLTKAVEEGFKNKVNGYPLTLKHSKGKKLIDYKIYGNSVQEETPNNLPSEYQELQYIQSTGTQYIDIGFQPNQNTSVEAKVLSTTSNSNIQFLWGARKESNRNTFGALYSVNPYARFDFYVSTTNTSFKPVTNTIYTYYQNKNKGYIDGVLYREYDNSTFSTLNNLYLFTTNTSGVANTNMFVGNMYYCKVWDNDELIRELIPCYRKSDDVVGMYDIVKGKFYTNLGTGDFIKGAEVKTSIKNVGDLVTDINDTNYGKYKIPITVNGKNLWNEEALEKNKWVASTKGYPISSTNGAKMLRIPAKKGETYTFSAEWKTKSTNNIIVVSCRDENDVALNRIVKNNELSSSISITAPANTASIVFARYVEPPQEIQIERGLKFTSYEKFSKITKNIYLDEPLRKVGNYADYIDFKNKKVVRNVKEENGVLSKLETPKIESISLPEVLIKSGTNIITVDTTVAPSNIEASYYAKEV